VQSVGALYPVHQRIEKRSGPIFKILNSQPVLNPPLSPPSQEPRFKIVDSQRPASESMGSADSSQYDCRYFHTEKGCIYGTRQNPKLCRWGHSCAVGRSLIFEDEQHEIGVVDTSAKRSKVWQSSRPLLGRAARPQMVRFRDTSQMVPSPNTQMLAPPQEGQIADDSGKRICYYFRDNGRCRRGTSCHFEHVDRTRRGETLTNRLSAFYIDNI
jgi:hypothetical protein